MTAEIRAGWTMTGPALTAIALFFAIPAAASLALSFTDFDIYALADIANLRYVGFDNYARLIGNPLFWRAMGNTLWFVVFGVPLTVALSLAAAILLDARTLRVEAGVARRVVRAVCHHARRDGGGVAVPAPHPVRADQLRAGLVRHRPDRLARQPDRVAAGDPDLRRVEDVRLQHGDLPGRAADGAAGTARGGADRRGGPFTRFRHVTLPAIGPTVLLVSILSIAGFFQLFAEPYVMTQGGPAQSTVTILYFMYEEGFKWWNLGTGSAVAFILFLCILLVTLLQLAIVKRMTRA